MECQGSGGLIMKRLAKYVAENGVEHSSSLVGNNSIPVLGKKLGVKIGPCLSEYITRYGYLIFSSVELYGVTGRQGLESDMVKQTEYLNKYFSKTCGYIALENQGDGDYYLVNSRDQVFEYDSETDKLTDLHLGLEDYILKRFKDVEN